MSQSRMFLDRVRKLKEAQERNNSDIPDVSKIANDVEKIGNKLVQNIHNDLYDMTRSNRDEPERMCDDIVETAQNLVKWAKASKKLLKKPDSKEAYNEWKNLFDEFDS